MQIIFRNPLHPTLFKSKCHRQNIKKKDLTLNQRETSVSLFVSPFLSK